MNKTKVRVSALLIVAATLAMGISNPVVTDNLLASLQSLRSTFHYSSYVAPSATTMERPSSPYINEQLRLFGDITSEEELIAEYQGDIIVESQISDETLLNLLYAAQRYRQNEILGSLLPIHQATMTTAKNWAALLSPNFPGVYRRGETNVDTYLSGYEISQMLAETFLKVGGNPLQEMQNLGLITASELTVWGNQNPTGILLSDAVGLLRRFVRLSEQSSVQDLVALTRNSTYALPQSPAVFDRAAVGAMLKAYALEKGAALEDSRTIEKYFRDMREYEGETLTSAMARELRDRYFRADAPAVYMPFHQMNLGRCDQGLLEKLTLSSFFETGDLGLNVTCAIDLGKGETGQLTMSIPPETVVLNLFGAPSVTVLQSRKATAERTGLEIQFPQNNGNTLFLGPNGEVPVTVRYQSDKRKPKSGKMGVVISGRNNQVLQSLTAGYDARFRAEIELYPRQLNDDQLTVVIDPLLQ